MERLEPVLKQKFWILLGVAVLMTFVGWWMATAKLAQAITARETAIDNSFKSVPTGEIPNESWAKRLGAVNEAQDASIKTTKLELWNRQVAKMTWPDGVVPLNGYWGKFSNEGREQFRETWRQEVRRVWLMLNPLDEDGKGVIDYPLTNMGKVLKKGNWKAAPPDSDVMWEGREDLWLLESLFQSLASINGGPNATRADASIHQIDKLEFRGGGEKKSAGGAAPADGGMGGMGGMAAMMSSAGYASSGTGLPNAGGPGPAGALSQGLTTVSAEFDPTEEFGDDGGGGSGPAGGSMSPMSSMSSMGGGAMGGMGGDMAAATAEKKVNRYLVLDEKLPYKQRGFYLSMKMDHRKIPTLIAELTSNEKSAWPVEIIRVQMSRLNEDDSPGSIPGGSSGSSSTSMTSMSMMSRLPSNYPTGGVTSSSSSLGEDEFSSQFASTALGNPEQQAMAKSVLDIALKDPVMAQVTICGTFTIYKKVDPPEVKPVTPAAGNSGEAANPDGSAGDKPETGAQAAAGGEKGPATAAASDDAPPVASTSDDKPPVASSTATEEKTESDKPDSDSPPPDKPDADKPDTDNAAADKKPD